MIIWKIVVGGMQLALGLMCVYKACTGAPLEPSQIWLGVSIAWICALTLTARGEK